MYARITYTYRSFRSTRAYVVQKDHKYLIPLPPNPSPFLSDESERRDIAFRESLSGASIIVSAYRELCISRVTLACFMNFRGNYFLAPL